MQAPALAPWRYRDFRLLWGGLFLSQIGNQMQMTALTWHIYQLSPHPLALGAIGLVRVIPIIAMALVGGMIADSWDRRRLLMLTQSCMLVSSAVLAAATFSGHTSLALLYLATAINGTLFAIDTPARQALLPSLVPLPVVSRALSLNVSSFQVATIVGPSVGGLVLSAGGPESVYVLDAMSYGGILGALGVMTYRAARKSQLRLGMAAIKEGLYFVRRTPIVWSTMWLDFFATLFGGCTLLLPIFAQDLFQVGPRGYGCLVAAPGVGAAVMATALAVRGLPVRQGRMVIVAVACYGAVLAGFGVSRSFPVALVLLALSGAADTASTVVRHTVRFTMTPESLRGRMSSINMIFFAGGPQLGEAEAGLLAHIWGARLAVVAGGLACLGLAGLYGWKDKALRSYRWGG